MSKYEKLLARMLSCPTDFTWEELIKILTAHGYEEFKKGKTGGARRKFVDRQHNVIALHKPHPGNVMKRYAINDVIAHLREKGHITNE